MTWRCTSGRFPKRWRRPRMPCDTVSRLGHRRLLLNVEPVLIRTMQRTNTPESTMRPVRPYLSCRVSRCLDRIYLAGAWCTHVPTLPLSIHAQYVWSDVTQLCPIPCATFRTCWAVSNVALCRDCPPSTKTRLLVVGRTSLVRSLRVSRRWWHPSIPCGAADRSRDRHCFH